MEKAKLETKRNVLFLVITFGLSWGYCFGIVRPLVDSAGLMGVPSVAAQLAVAAMMLFPALGVVLTVATLFVIKAMTKNKAAQ